MIQICHLLFSPGIDLPPDVGNFIDYIPVAIANIKLKCSGFVELTDDDLNDFVLDNEKHLYQENNLEPY